MIAYLDTSALVKLILDEPGSTTVGDIWDASDRRVTSVAAIPEGRSALAAARRMGRIDGRQLGWTGSQFRRILESMNLVELGTELGNAAGDLAQLHGLRGYDAVHLASALDMGDPDALMVTWDADLARAAADAGLAVTAG